ncbi:MAG: EutN/CcmL family microcompartment protein [Pirellulaceae bacterium]|nr:EutN/CcmL family microcompartment protein [Pirellulaceae bacterium]
MFVARVAGSVVSTQKVDALVGYKLLVVEPYRLEQKKRASLSTTGRTFVAVDMLGAGEGEYVLITQGSSARLTPETRDMPIDTVVVGIVDQVTVGQACVYTREDDE